MHRFRLTWLGELIESHSPVTTFKTVLVIVLCYFIFDASLTLYVNPNPFGYMYGENLNQGYYDMDNPVIFIFIWLRRIVRWSFSLWSIYSLYKLRKYVRMTYSIPEQSCYGCEDCLCATFCACCTGKILNM